MDDIKGRGPEREEPEPFCEMTGPMPDHEVNGVGPGAHIEIGGTAALHARSPVSKYAAAGLAERIKPEIRWPWQQPSSPPVATPDPCYLPRPKSLTRRFVEGAVLSVIALVLAALVGIGAATVLFELKH